MLCCWETSSLMNLSLAKQPPAPLRRRTLVGEPTNLEVLEPYWKEPGPEPRNAGAILCSVSRGLADRLMRWGNNRANRGGWGGGGASTGVCSTALQGLPASLLGRAATGQCSLTPGRAAQWAGRPSSEQPRKEALVIVFLCDGRQALSAFVAMMYVFILLLSSKGSSAFAWNNRSVWKSPIFSKSLWTFLPVVTEDWV